MKTVAIVGKTNVGKSTFFNRLCGRKLAIVHDRPGVTRDRKEAMVHLKELTFNLVDTAGLEETTELAAAMWRQTQIAIEQADVILFMIDARAELTRLDEQLAAALRKTHKPVLVIANKCEGREQQYALGEVYKLGLGAPLPFSAEHKLGVTELYEALKKVLPSDSQEAEADSKKTEEASKDAEADSKKTEEASKDAEAVHLKNEKPLRLAIVGRPNVGKSTLINQLLGTERLLTGPMAGVTRDAITIPFTYRNQALLLTDTAGLRKRGRVTDTLETISALDTQNAIDFAETVILVLDATMPMERQDLNIASYVIEQGRCLLIALNKWDTVQDPKQTLKDIKETLACSLQQVKNLPLATISAKTGYGIDRMMSDVFTLYAKWNKRVATHKLNLFLSEMTQAHPTPMTKNGRRVPLKYMTQVNARPPTFVIFSSNPDPLPDSYVRYLSNGLRDQFGLSGVPIRIHMRKRENPYAEKAKNKPRLNKRHKRG